MAKRRSDDDDRVEDDHGWAEDGGDDDAELDGSDHDEADQRRFSSNIAYCPECGAEVIDDADLCPKCFSWIDGTTHRKPSKLKRSIHVAVVVLLIVAGVVGCVGFVLVMR